MINDGTKQYDHDADGTHTELAGCQANFRNKNHPTRARLSYVNNVLSVCARVRMCDVFFRVSLAQDG